MNTTYATREAEGDCNRHIDENGEDYLHSSNRVI